MITQKQGFMLVLLLILLFIPVYFGSQVRMATGELAQTDFLAENAVLSSLQQQIAQQVQAQMPFSSPQAQQQEINRQLAQLIEQDRQAFDAQVQQLSRQYKQAFQHEDGQTYLLELDPYYYYRILDNMLTNGHPGEYIGEDGISYSNLRLAPTPEDMFRAADDFHIQFSYYYHRFINIFTDTPLHTTYFYLPVFLMSLAIISMFFLARRLAGDFAGFFAATLLAFHPLAVMRTVGGFSSTDGWNMLFPVLAIWMIVEAILATKLWQKSLFSALAGLAVGLFAYAWSGWWFIFYVVVAGFGLYLLSYILAKENWTWRAITVGIGAVIASLFMTYTQVRSQEVMITLFTVAAIYAIVYIVRVALSKRMQAEFFAKPFVQMVHVGVVFVLATALFVTIFSGFSRVVQLILTPFTSLDRFTTAANPTLFPNIMTTVAELNPSTFSQAINSATFQFTGFFILLAFAGMILLYFTSKIKHESKINYTLPSFLIAWFVITLAMAIVAVRFQILFAPAFALAAGVAFGQIIRFTQNQIEDKVVYWTVLVIIIIGSLVLIVPQYDSAFGQVTGLSMLQGPLHSGLLPMMNDDQYNLLINIQENSQEDAIISSWWDFGHHFTGVARRGATADGSTQNNPQSYWLAQALTTEDPKEFNDISRMLNCNANGAFEIINELEPNPLQAINITKTLIAQESREQALAYAQEQNLPDTIIDSTHCEPEVESFWVASEDMIGKAPVWGHFGLWDFERAQAWRLRNRPEFLTFAQETFNYTPIQARQLQTQLRGFSERQGNEWIATYPQFLGSSRSAKRACTQDGESITCEVQIGLSQNSGIATVEFTQNLTDISMLFVEGNQQGRVSPDRVFFTDGQIYDLVEQNEQTTGISLTISQEQGRYFVLLAQDELIASTFTKLFFYGGAGMHEYVTEFDRVDMINGQRWIVYTRNVNQ
ncbi:MAG: STT3 domain-containing protein [Candidatus Woesearchaeota archaeon]